ncbi:pyridoxamine 5'-phosphate oxidase-domain-containing protein [Aspergillus desertorum]
MAPVAPLAYGLCLLGTLSRGVLATPVSGSTNERSNQAPLAVFQDSLVDYPSGDAIMMNFDEESPLPPSWWTSTLMARRLLALSTSGVASTIFPEHLPPYSRTPDAVAGHSASLKEYFADCDEALPPESGNGGDGNPIFLALHVATTFRNTAAGSNISLSIDWWDHLNQTTPVFPGFPLSAAGLPRVTLFGYIVPFKTPIPSETEKALKECYVAAHPDSKVWLPGRVGSPHSSFWAKMVVTQVYWIGGFGGLQQIGWINMDQWKGIRRKGSLPGVGDGRGWEDVRLPGEGS